MLASYSYITLQAFCTDILNFTLDSGAYKTALITCALSGLTT
uniref:Uncharacterized protein n=1 Tax=Anguilla anguilla TaxID=7936 RepID=A0A0E9UBB0_ANGAN